MKNISIAKTNLKLKNGNIITIKGYDEMADWMIQNIKKEDKVILQGKINTKKVNSIYFYLNRIYLIKKILKSTCI